MMDETYHYLLQIEYEQQAEIDEIRDAWSFNAEDARPLAEDLLERGIDPGAFAASMWPPSEGTDAFYLLKRLSL